MTDLLERLKTALADRYRTERELGSGGMATVYLAHDLKHDRRVALKVMRPELSAILGGERFLREIRIAAKLNHPNILALHDSGEADGFLYYVMPYVEGESLRDKLNHERQLAIEQAVQITEQVASALDYAHRHDVIHRDIKPENILLHEGGAIVADFGIALAVRAAGGNRLTETGLSLGTPQYMSPEQATADRDLDGRSDVYSLACVLYEMLAGEAPHTGPTAQAIIAKVISRTPEPLTALRDTVPVHVEAVVRRALAKLPADRFATASQFAEALTRPADSPVPPELKSIAVLPFANLSADPENEYFSDGLTEELINALTKIRDLRVVARTSAFSFKGKDADIREVGRRLNVESVLEGSVRKAGNRMRITAQLVNVTDGYHLWSERYERKLEDVFAIQDEITLAIVDKLSVGLLKQEREDLLTQRPEDLAAFTLYLKGRFNFHKLTIPDLQKAAQFFQQAIDLDPDYAKAYAGLAGALMFMGGAGPSHFLRPCEAYPKARAAVAKAMELDNRLAEAHTMLGVLRTGFEWDLQGAKQAFKRALELNPNNADTHLWFAWHSWKAGQLDAASASVECGLVLDPLSLLFHLLKGHLRYCARRYDEAIAQYRQIVDWEPGSFVGHLHVGDAYLARGMHENAEAAYQKARELAGQHHAYLYTRFCELYAAWNRPDEAQRYLDEILAMAEEEFVPPTYIGWAYLALGRHDDAFASFDKALEERDPQLLLRLWPSWDPVKADPRYMALVNKMGLAP
jgi:serine/threonine-protein kinase